MGDHIRLLVDIQEQNDARARAPCAVLAAARSTDPGRRRTTLDHRTACHRARTGAHARVYHQNNFACAHLESGNPHTTPQGNVVGIHVFVWRIVGSAAESCLWHGARVAQAGQGVAHQAQVWSQHSQDAEEALFEQMWTSNAIAQGN